MKRVLLIALMIMFFGVVLFSSFSLGSVGIPGCGCYQNGTTCYAQPVIKNGQLTYVCPSGCNSSYCNQGEPGLLEPCGCYPNGNECFTTWNDTLGDYNPCPANCSFSNCGGGTQSGGGTIPATLVNVEGKLINKNGPPISGQVSMKFEFYNAPTGGILLFNVSGSSVNVTDGFFAVEVPIAKTPKIVSALVENQLYVQIYVNGAALNPRIRITPSVSSIASEYLDVYTSEDFVKRAGDIMKGNLDMGGNDLLNAGNVYAQDISGATIYENGMRLEDKYMARNKAFGMFENIWCNSLSNCYYYTTRSKPVDVVYGRVGLGNFNASEIKQGFVRFPQSLPSTPVVVASIESCTGMFNVNLQGPSEYGFFVRVENLENYSTSCGGGIFLNFIAVTYGGQNKQSASILQGWTTYQPNTMTCYKDNDNDGYGDPNNSITTTQSSCPSGYVSNAGDCNDNDSSINPGASETYDGIDDNCDGSLGPGECASNANCSSYPGICDTSTHKCEVQCGIDNDGDNYIVTQNYDLSCPSGWTQLSGFTGNIDCNDNNANIHPGATDVCNGVDDDCDGTVDEDASCPEGEECINGSCQSVSGGGDHNPPHPPECQAGEDKCT